VAEAIGSSTCPSPPWWWAPIAGWSRPNPAACELTGRASLTGVLLDDLLAPVDGEEPRWLRAWDPSARLRSVTGFPEHEVNLRRPDGADGGAVVAGSYRRAPTARSRRP